MKDPEEQLFCAVASSNCCLFLRLKSGLVTPPWNLSLQDDLKDIISICMKAHGLKDPGNSRKSQSDVLPSLGTAS